MKRSITIAACCTVVIVLLYGFFSLTLFETSAKYTDYKELNHFFESKEMYISSEDLSIQDNKYNIINYYNFNDINLNIVNSINDNQITSYDINYSLECTILNNSNEEYKCIIDNQETNTVTSILTSQKKCIENETFEEEECINNNLNYNLIKTTNNHKFKIINNNGNKEKLEVELTLQTTSPYSKTLKAIYILNIGDDKNNDISISEVKDYNSFCEYNISNNNYIEKNIKIIINTNNLMFDTSSEIYTNKIDYTLDYNNRLDSLTFKINNNKQIKLYKKDFTYNCNINDINYVILN